MVVKCVHRQHELLPENLCELDEPFNQLDPYLLNIFNKIITILSHVTHSAVWRLRGKCSTAGYNLSAATSSPWSQLMITTTTDDHHFEWGSHPGGQGHNGDHTRTNCTSFTRLTSAWLKTRWDNAVWCEMCWAEQKATTQTYLCPAVATLSAVTHLICYSLISLRWSRSPQNNTRGQSRSSLRADL